MTPTDGQLKFAVLENDGQPKTGGGWKMQDWTNAGKTRTVEFAADYQAC